MPQATGDVPGEWLAALQAALVGAARAETEPLPGEPGQDVEFDPASRRSRPLRAEEEPSAPPTMEAGEPAATRLAPAVWDGFAPRLDPAAGALESGRGEEAATTAPLPSAPESVPASAEPPLPAPKRAENGAARPGAGSEQALRTVKGAPVGRAPALEPSRAPAVEAASDPLRAAPIEVRKTESRSLSAEPTPLGRAREPELAFHAKITQRPISPAATAAPHGTATPVEAAAGAAQKLERPRAARSSAGPAEQAKSGNPVAQILPAPRLAPAERTRAVEAAPEPPPADRPGGHLRELRRQGQVPRAVLPRADEPAAPGAEARAASGREPVGATRALRVGPPAPVATEPGPPLAAPSSAATKTVKPSTSASDVPAPLAAPPAPVGEPVRRVELRVGGTAEANVSLQVVDRGGRLEVAVRTPDHDLAGSLRQALPDLVRRMEQVGFRAETWAPDGAALRAAEPAEPARAAAADLTDPREGGRHAGGGEPGGEREEARERRAQLEPGDGAAEDGKENERWAVWLWR